MLPQIVIGILLLVSGMTSAQSGTGRAVPPSEAQAHCIRRVDPIFPAIGKLTKVGGSVKLRIEISAGGEVVSSKALSGAPVLVQAAIDAVKQWKYTPFLEDGKAVMVSTEVEIDFPTGMSNGEKAVRARYFPLVDECRALFSDRKFSDAEEKCREAIKVSGDLPKDAVLERTDALGLLGNCLYVQGRYSEAIDFYKEALSLDKGYLSPDDADLATAHENLGRAYAAVGEASKADELYSVAVSTFRAAIKNLPDMVENYSRRLKRALNEYAQLKDIEGQADPASQLRKEAADIHVAIN